MAGRSWEDETLAQNYRPLSPEETHDLLLLPMRVNETAAALKLVKSVQQSVSDCYSAKVILFHDPGSSFHLLQTSHSSLLLEFQKMVEIQVLNQKRHTA